MSVDAATALEVLEQRLNTILPEEYQDVYEDVPPVSMGSVGLKYGIDGKVAWNEIWTTFCDLAMAGGPPHKGVLLEPGDRREIDAEPARYGQVLAEICRGVRMVTDLWTEPSRIPGWVQISCDSDVMTQWLVRAIVMENVAARGEGMALYLPASPSFRLEKEIKNVVTVIAKTCHYWLGHVPRSQQRAIASLFVTMEDESPLVEPAFFGDGHDVDPDRRVHTAIAESIHRTIGLCRSSHRYAGWLGLECPSVRAAIWMMRAMVVSNVLARREGSTLFVPVNPVRDPDGIIVSRSLANVYRLAAVRGVL